MLLSDYPDLISWIIAVIQEDLRFISYFNESPGPVICRIISRLLPLAAFLYTAIFWKKKALRNVVVVGAGIYFYMLFVREFPEIFEVFHPNTFYDEYVRAANDIETGALIAIIVCIGTFLICWCVNYLTEKLPRYIKERVSYHKDHPIMFGKVCKKVLSIFLSKVSSVLLSVVAVAVRLLPIVVLITYDLSIMERSMNISWFNQLSRVQDLYHPEVYNIIHDTMSYVGGLIKDFFELVDHPGALLCWLLAGPLPYIALLYTMFFWKKKALRNVQVSCGLIYVLMSVVIWDPNLIGEFHPNTWSIIVMSGAGRIADRAMLAILVCMLAAFINWSIEHLQEKVPQCIGLLKEKVPRYINLLKEKVKK